MAPTKTVAQLCQEVKDAIPAEYREECWYLVAASALIASGKPEAISDFYTFLTQQASDSEKARLSYRLRDVFMKEWTLVGIPLVIVAIVSLAKVEGEAETANKGLSIKWKEAKLDEALSDRGTNFMQTIYKENLEPIFSSWASHLEDFEWMEKHIIYGLYLSDHTVLSAIETEMVVLTSIMCQGVAAPTYWHLRGLRRLGVSEDDVESIQTAVENVARWCGRSVEGWPRAKDVTEVR